MNFAKIYIGQIAVISKFYTKIYKKLKIPCEYLVNTLSKLKITLALHFLQHKKERENATKK